MKDINERDKTACLKWRTTQELRELQRFTVGSRITAHHSVTLHCMTQNATLYEQKKMKQD